MSTVSKTGPSEWTQKKTVGDRHSGEPRRVHESIVKNRSVANDRASVLGDHDVDAVAAAGPLVGENLATEESLSAIPPCRGFLPRSTPGHKRSRDRCTRCTGRPRTTAPLPAGAGNRRAPGRNTVPARRSNATRRRPTGQSQPSRRRRHQQTSNQVNGTSLKLSVEGTPGIDSDHLPKTTARDDASPAAFPPPGMMAVARIDWRERYAGGFGPGGRSAPLRGLGSTHATP